MSEVYNPAGHQKNRQTEAWHLDKKLPVAIIITLMAQFVAAIWWAAKMDARDGDQERRLTSVELRQDGTQQQLQKLNERVARMDERLGLQIELLKEIKVNVGGRR